MGISAETVTIEILARLDKADADIKRLGESFDKTSGKTKRAANDIERDTARIANGTRNLGRQISDIGTQVAGGQSPFLILAQQAPQVADALADTGGKAAKVAAFFAGPWGAAFLAAGSVVGVLAGKLLEGGSAADAHKKAVDSLKEAEDRLRDSSAALNHATTQGIQDDIDKTRVVVLREQATRRQIQAELALAKAVLQANLAQGTRFSGEPEGHAAAAGIAILSQTTRAQIAAYDAQIAEQDRLIGKSNAAIRTGQAKAVFRQIAGETDKATAAAQRYEDAVDELQRKFDVGLIGRDAFKAGALAAEQGKIAALDGIKAQRSAETAAHRDRIREAKEYAKLQEGLAITIGKARLIIQDKSELSLKQLGIDPAADLKAVQRELDAVDVRRQTAQSNDYAPTHENEKRLQDERERNVRTLAGLYEDLFTGGTKNLWATFERMGISALANLAAKQTAAGIFSVLGKVGTLLAPGKIQGLSTAGLTSALSGISASVPSAPAIFGRASGGYVGAGEMYRVNEGSSPGRVEGFKPAGSGTIIPLGQMANARGGGTTIIHQHSHFDLSGAVMTADLLAQMQAIGDSSAARGADGGMRLARMDLARRSRNNLR